MSLQVHDPRSPSRSNSPRRSRERSRSRDSRVPSPSPSRDYGPDEVEPERQYKLSKESRLREPSESRGVEPRTVIDRAPRSPARYDVARSDSEDEGRQRQDRDAEKSRRREDRYEHSDSEHVGDVKTARREYLKPSSPAPTSQADDSDDALAYGETPGSHPSYARPSRYQYAQPAQFLHAQPGHPRQPVHPEDRSDWAPIPECERPGYVPPPTSQTGPPSTSTMPGGFPPVSTYADIPATTAPSFPAPQYAGLSSHQQIPYAHVSSSPYVPSHYRTASAGDAAHVPPVHYSQPMPYQYAQVDPNVKYTSKATPVQPYTASPQQQFARAQPLEQSLYPYRYSYEPQFGDKPQLQQQPYIVEITPGGGRSSARPRSVSASSASNLGVTGAHAGYVDHRPASPLLEPYHGTYQSMSPMPSPIAVPVRDDELSDVEPLDGGTLDSESGRRQKRSPRIESESRRQSNRDKSKEREKDKRRSRASHDRADSSPSMILISPTSGRKRVTFYDAAADAAAMQSALNHTRNIDTKTIIQILPQLTSDEILLLRQEYKTKVKLHGKGINLAKHLRLKLGTSSFGKVVYATALGRWGSEAYWANYYYQAGTSRRELLIESLMGRSNGAIREIKACFRDSRYGDSLERCMRAELRADKFRMAVLLALEERRQEEREPVEARLVRQDVVDLHRALVAREGGESAMIRIIVARSDAHLREVLRAYEGAYGYSFARAMIAKSRNLVVSIPSSFLVKPMSY